MNARTAATAGASSIASAAARADVKEAAMGTATEAA